MLDNSIARKFSVKTGKQIIKIFLGFSMIVINENYSHNTINIIVQYQCLADSDCRYALSEQH